MIGTSFLHRLIFTLILLFQSKLSSLGVVEGCTSCLFSPFHHRIHHHHHNHHSFAGIATAAFERHSSLLPYKTRTSIFLNNNGVVFLVAFRTMLQTVQSKQIITPMAITATGVLVTHRIWKSTAILRSSDEDHQEAKEEDEGGDEEQEVTKPVVTSAMVGTIGIYKNFISPLLPPACRFLPTCSQYGVQAIEEFGPTKGCILTAWRLLRCSPVGGRGYDPPKWPPVPYNYGSY